MIVINNEYSIWVKIIKFFAPYYEPKPKKKKKKNKTKDKKEKEKKEKKEKKQSKLNNINNNEVEQELELEQEQELEQELEQEQEQIKEEKTEQNQENHNNINKDDDNNNNIQKEQSKSSTTIKTSQKNKSNAQKRRDEFDKPVMENLTNDQPYISLADEKMIMPIFNVNNQLDDAINMEEKPKLNQIWFYHDENRHQVFAHLGKGTGNVCKSRNDELRRNMTPWIRPRIKKKFDRTHLIPIGYHGSDGDQRLIIGWDSNHNQNELKNFEFKQKKRNEDIYWLTDVQKTKDGAVWNYKIYSAKTNKLLDSLTLRMDKTQFMWRK